MRIISDENIENQKYYLIFSASIIFEDSKHILFYFWVFELFKI